VRHPCELSLLDTIAEYQNKDVNKLNSLKGKCEFEKMAINFVKKHFLTFPACF
jgi:hypothetical protein